MIRRCLLSCVCATLLAPPSIAGEKDKALEMPSGAKPKPSGIVAGKKLKASSVPELDASASGSAAVLLLGGTLVALGRRRRESSTEAPSRLAIRGG